MNILATNFHDQIDVPDDFVGYAYFLSPTLLFSESLYKYENGVGVITNDPVIIIVDNTIYYYADRHRIHSESKFWAHPKAAKHKLNSVLL